MDIVREIYTKYANGWSIKEICDSLNERQLKSAQGASFNKSSLHTLLKNRKYLGIYIYAGKEIPGGMPQIIDEDLFNKVAQIMEENKKAPARSRAKAEYILSGKLFCGQCKEKMVGHSSNQMSKKGVIFNYYKCKNSGGKKPCNKKMIAKNYIEDIVVNECRKILTPNNIRRIAREVVKISQSMDDRTELKRLEDSIKRANIEKENQMVSLRICKDDIIREMIFEDLGKIAATLKELEKQLEIEKSRHYVLTEEDVCERLRALANAKTDDIEYRKSMIRLFVNRVYLYDDRFTITFNVGDDEVTIDNVLLSEIEKNLSGEKLCLLNKTVHQTKIRSRKWADFCFYYSIFNIEVTSGANNILKLCLLLYYFELCFVNKNKG